MVMTKKYVGIMVGVVAWSFVPSTPVSADPPVRYSFTVEDTQIFNCEDGSVLTEPFAYTENGRDVYRDSVVTRTVGHAFFDGIVTNVMTGAQFRDSNHFSFEIDYVANTFTYRGVIFQLHSLEGGPVLLLDAGTITGDLDTGDVIRGSVKHPATSPNVFMDYTDVLCEAVGA